MNWESLCSQLRNLDTMLPGGYGLFENLAHALLEGASGVSLLHHRPTHVPARAGSRCPLLGQHAQHL
eukprot:3538658-Ditylum_brightwellii.AAC.1